MSTTDQSNVDLRPGVRWALAGVAVVLVLGGLTRLLEQTVPGAAEGNPPCRVV
jgi:hypothetical protein